MEQFCMKKKNTFRSNLQEMASGICKFQWVSCPVDGEAELVINGHGVIKNDAQPMSPFELSDPAWQSVPCTACIFPVTSRSLLMALMEACNGYEPTHTNKKLVFASLCVPFPIMRSRNLIMTDDVCLCCNHRTSWIDFYFP